MSTDRSVMTVLEARVPQEKWAELEARYGQSIPLPAQMIETFLVQSTDDPELWRGVSVWRSRAELEAYRRSVDVPGGFLIFRSVGAEPSVSVFDVVTSRAN
jgi:hypothetical protein